MKLEFRTIRLLGMVAALVLLAAACKGGEGPAGPQGPAGPPGQQGPAGVSPGQPTAIPMPTPTAMPTPSPADRYGGILTSAIENDPPHVDPVTNKVTEYFHPWSNVYNQIVQYNWKEPTGQIVPDLAESWDISNNLLTYTFRIRDGVKWHDGRTFTAEDAKWGVEILKDSASWVKSEFESIDTVAAPDARTLVITLKNPRASFLQVLGLSFTPMVARHVYDAADGDLKGGPNIGTGPFKEQQYTKGTALDLVFNADYFEEGLPFLDGIKFLVIKEDLTRRAAFRTGRLDILGFSGTAVNREQLEELKRGAPDLSPNEHETVAVHTISVNSNSPPWDDVRVRRAAFLAVDRWDAQKVLANASAPAGPPMPPLWRLSDEELLALPGYRQGADKEKDREEARQLLAEAGYPEGFDTTINVISTIPRLVNLQVFFIDQVAKVGIRAKSQPMPVSEFIEKANNQQFDLQVLSPAPAYPDPDATIAYVKGPTFYTNLEDAETLDLFAQQSVERDPDRRRELVYELQRLMIEAVHLIPVAHVVAFLPSQPWVKDFTPPVGVRTHTRLDHVWLEK